MTSNLLRMQQSQQNEIQQQPQPHQAPPPNPQLSESHIDTSLAKFPTNALIPPLPTLELDQFTATELNKLKHDVPYETNKHKYNNSRVT